MIISVVYEFIMYCRSKQRFRCEASYCETIFIQVKRFGTILQLKFSEKSLGLLILGIVRYTVLL